VLATCCIILLSCSIGLSQSGFSVPAPQKRPQGPKGTVADTAEPIGNKLWGFGIGWQLGQSGIFSAWQENLPDSLGDFGIEPTYPSADSVIRVRWQITEKPNSYTVFFPLYLYRHYQLNNSVVLQPFISWRFLRKSSVATIHNDSLTQSVDIRNRLFTQASEIGLQLLIKFSDEYFTIDKTRFSALGFSVGALPYTTLHSYNTVITDNATLPPFSTFKPLIEPALNSTSQQGAGGSVGVFLYLAQKSENASFIHCWSVGYRNEMTYFPSQTAEGIWDYRLEQTSGYFNSIHQFSIRWSLFKNRTEPADTAEPKPILPESFEAPADTEPDSISIKQPIPRDEKE